jgi:hypothetical protein
MVINTISTKNKGFAVGAFLFWASIFGMSSTLTLGAIVDKNKEKFAKDPADYGKVLSLFVTIPYAVSMPFFYLAGRGYEKVKKAELEAKLREEQEKLLQ